MGGEIVDDTDDGPVPTSGPLFSAPAASATPHAYSFFPQGGTLWQDLVINNHVDLATAGAPFDFDCTDRTYAGHRGHDSDIVGFREQEIGVPIFAALDGTVVSTHDGEYDMNTQALGQPANYVILAHANGHYSWYWHLKKNSVLVSPGQSVTAGTQIGLTGSSGSSTWPHLHFESQVDGVPYEPSAGPCRAGSSYWVNQVPVRQATFVKTFTFASGPFSGFAGYPYDQVMHSGTYVLGTVATYFRMSIANWPVGGAYRVTYTRPNGTTALDFAGVLFPGGFRNGWLWFSMNPGGGLDVVGTWTARFYANDALVVTAPFDVVATAPEIVNHAPFRVSVLLDPPNPVEADVPFCRVTSTVLYRRDPDYDVVHYRYRWFVNGSVVRDLTSAALSDALPKGWVSRGDAVTCAVTPLDDYGVSGPDATVSNHAQRGDFDGDGRADVTVFRPSTGVWHTMRSTTGTPTAFAWGNAADKPVVGDFDGDRRTDIAVFRPSNGTWYVVPSTTGVPYGYAWGNAADVPAPGDYDGDGKTDITVFRPSNGTWYVVPSTTGVAYGLAWGNGADVPVPGDYDGDGKTDITVFRSSNGTWYVVPSTGAAPYGFAWGNSADKPVAADYDGDGRTDIAVFRPSNGTWYIVPSTTGVAYGYAWGNSADTPVPADYDGDGKTDIAVFRPSNGTWYVVPSTTGVPYGFAWGNGADVPILKRP